MTNAELKDALLSGCPVECNGIRYQRVCEIVYRCPAGQLIVSAGMLDPNGNCIVYALADKISKIEERKE